MEKPVVYSKESCVQCTATYRALDGEGIDYDVVMLEENPHLIEGFRAENLLQAPIVDTGVEKWSGFRPDKIKELGKAALNGQAEVIDAQGPTSER